MRRPRTYLRVLKTIGYIMAAHERELWRSNISGRTLSSSVVVVTGASGFVGTHCVRECLRAGYSVRATVRNVQVNTSSHQLCNFESNYLSGQVQVRPDTFVSERREHIIGSSGNRAIMPAG